MFVNWELVLAAAFAAIGLMEYLKGFAQVPGWVLRVALPLLCILFAATFLLLPAWVMVGILALALAQIGYQTIIETVKKKLNKE